MIAALLSRARTALREYVGHPWVALPVIPTSGKFNPATPAAHPLRLKRSNALHDEPTEGCPVHDANSTRHSTNG